MYSFFHTKFTVSWTKMYFTVISLILLNELQPTVAKRDFYESPVMCFECSSRSDTFCEDPFNSTVSINFVRTVECRGYCAKFAYKYPENEWIERSCTQNLSLGIDFTSECMEHGKLHGTMCFCDDDYCNEAKSIQGASSSFACLISLIVCYLTMF